MTLGVGFGWNRAEAEDHGVDFGRRCDVVREHLAAMEAIWSSEQAEFHGEFVDFGPTWSWPKPVQQPRVRTLIGGGARESVFAAVASYADGWIPIGGGGLGEALPRLRALAEAGGARSGGIERRPVRHHRRARASSSTTPGSGITEVVLRIRAGSRPEVRAQLETVGAPRPLRGHTGVTMTDLIDDTDPPARQHHAAARRSSAWTTTSSSQPTSGRPGSPPASGTADPEAERRGIGEMEHIGGGTYRQTFDPDGPQADCWVYEDLVYINKRHVAAVGFDRDDMTMSPITYDEMRPGCYEPKARIADNEANWVEASLCFPTFPRFCGQTFLEAKDRELAEACVRRLQRLHGRGVVRRQRRQADPALHHPAVGRGEGRGRGAAQRRPRRARRLLQRDPAPPRACPSIHSGYWDPFFAACEETGTVVCMHIGSSSKMPATSADAPVAVAATLSFGNAMASLTDFLFSGVLVRFPALAWPTRRARSAGCPTSSSGPTTSGASTGPGAG